MRAVVAEVAGLCLDYSTGEVPFAVIRPATGALRRLRHRRPSDRAISRADRHMIPRVDRVIVGDSRTRADRLDSRSCARLERVSVL
jgi:hypothetical protein